MKFEADVYGVDPKVVEESRRSLTDIKLEVKSDLENYLSQIEEWEYCYCQKCRTIKFASDLDITADGIRCSKCKSDKLEEPGWVECPHHKDSIVKCPRAGKGIVKMKYGYECQDHCYFRAT